MDRNYLLRKQMGLGILLSTILISFTTQTSISNGQEQPGCLEQAIREIERIREIFEKYNDPVRAKMARFFLLSYKISMIGLNQEYKKSINEISDIYQWMLDKGELHYSEMIGQFLELVNQFR